MLTSPDSPTESPSIEDFLHNLQQAQRRIEQLRGCDQASSVQNSHHQIETTCEELLMNLEQLRVAEAELRQQNEELYASRTMLEYAQSRYEDLFEFAPDAYLMTDLQGTIRECNQAAAALLGLSSQYAPGKPLLAFVHERQRRMVRTLINGFSKTNLTRTWEFEMLTRSVGRIPVSAKICRTHAKTGQWVGLLWIIRDMSTQIAAEEQLRTNNQELERRVTARTRTLEQSLHREHNANNAKVNFLASLSHEIRTPLHALMAYTDMLSQELRGPITELQAKDLGRMRQGHDYILGLISRILDFARLENGQIALQPVAVNVSTCVCEVMEMLQSQYIESDIQCPAPSGAQDVTVLADVEAFRQVLINLVGNAIKFNIPQGTVTISWEICGDRAGIHVCDTGPGIAAENLEFIFEPFVRVAADAQDRAGTGLGLPISRALAEAMHGTLEVHSVLHEGSTFSLWLPLGHSAE